MSRARKHFGRIDILINNVGGTIWVQRCRVVASRGLSRELATGASNGRFVLGDAELAGSGIA
jgi:NAD(P)-dependent dehydrogenase (short-subunit alcohol dehydrogenase family)